MLGLVPPRGAPQGSARARGGASGLGCGRAGPGTSRLWYHGFTVVKTLRVGEGFEDKMPILHP